jgi:EmrB/QacA subfamily drug resistance transporter
MTPEGVAGAAEAADEPAICRTPPAPPTRTEKRIVLGIALLAGFLTPFDGSAVNIALPAIGAEFHMDAITLSWIATAYLLASALFIVPFGRLADIHGRKKIFLLGLTIFTLASLAQTLVPSSAAMIAVRAIQGAGSAMIFGTTVAILTSVVPKQERGRSLGLYITAVYLGLMVGPLLGGLLTQNFGWRSIFWINIPIGITVILLVLLRLKGEWAECQGERFDLAGSVLYAFGLVGVMYGLSELPALTGAALIVAGIAVLAVFVWYELRVPSPVLNMELFTRSRAFLFSNLAALINYSATFAVTFLLSLYLQYTKGLSPQSAGFILIAQAVVQMAISPYAGRLSDRMDARIVASIGMGVTTVGLGLLVFLTDTTTIWYIILSLVVLGLGFGLFSSPNTNAIMSAVDRRYYGVASGMNGTMRLIGQMFSMGLATMVFAIMIGRVEITPPYYAAFVSSIRVAFFLFMLLCLAGIGASLSRGPTR